MAAIWLTCGVNGSLTIVGVAVASVSIFIFLAGASYVVDVLRAAKRSKIEPNDQHQSDNINIRADGAEWGAWETMRKHKESMGSTGTIIRDT